MERSAHYLYFVILSLAAACGGGDGASGNASAGLCQEICAKEELCNSATDELECRDVCTEDRAFSSLFWGAQHACTVSEVSCNELGTSAEADCINDALRAGAPTGVGTAACMAAAQKSDTCDESVDEMQVLENCTSFAAKAFSDAFLARVQECFADSSCDVVPGCIATAADDLDVDEEISAFDVVALFTSDARFTGGSGSGGSGGSGGGSGPGPIASVDGCPEFCTVMEACDSDPFPDCEATCRVGLNDFTDCRSEFIALNRCIGGLVSCSDYDAYWNETTSPYPCQSQEAAFGACVGPSP